MDVQRAYSAFEVKALDKARRTFTGWATTPATDRVGDTINPLGVRYQNPLALLHQHRHDEPVGSATFKTPTKRGIEFEGEMPVIGDEYPALRERVDNAWGELKHGLVRFTSIGFRPIKYAFKDDGGIDYQEIEVYELSVVTIPALPEAVITQVKSMDGKRLPADVVRLIRSADAGGSVKLIRGNANIGAVRLLK